jgi:ATP-binding cassette subfamily F protein uup
MLAQRRDEALEQKKATREKAAPDGEAVPATVPMPRGKAKLSYKQKFAIENLPKEIAAKEAEAGKIEARMANPAFFAKDPDGFSKAAKELEAVRAALARMEEEWLELEMLREELEG